MRLKYFKLEGGCPLIQVYTGSGKGKTTAALGLALRAAGAGLRIYIAQFAKGKKCSEFVSLKKIKKITVQQFGTCRFVRSPTAADIALAKKGLDSVKEKIKSKKFDLIILDEINNALNLGLLEINQVLEAIKTGICGPEIILTGRNAPKKIIKIADLVSEIKEVKHYYARGIKARKGIEY